MAAWHEDARFNVFTDCDVFIEDGEYLYVENRAFDYSGRYACRDYQQGRNADNTFFYMRGEYSGADNDYIMTLEKAPWNIARDIIMRELDSMIRYYNEIEDNEAVETACIIEGAEDALMTYGNEGEKFTYC